MREVLMVIPPWLTFEKPVISEFYKVSGTNCSCPNLEQLVTSVFVVFSS